MQSQTHFWKSKLFVFESISDVLPKAKVGEGKRKKEESRTQPTTNLAYKQVLSLQSHVGGMLPLEAAKPRVKPGNQGPVSQEAVGSSLQADSLAD